MRARINNPGELNFSQPLSPFMHNISSPKEKKKVEKERKEKHQMKKRPQNISKINRIKRFSQNEVCKGFEKIYLTGHL